jgi:transposase-like protein
MRRHYTGEQRSDLVDLVAGGKATVSEAAARLGVRSSTAYYWMRQAAEGRGPKRLSRRSRKGPGVIDTTFVRLVPSSGEVDAAIAVRVGDAEIQVRRGFDEELLRAVVVVLGGGAT